MALDLSDGYRSFARDFFPNAQLVADKFQVLRLVQPAIYRYIRQLELGRDALPLYKLLRRNPLKLSPELRRRVRTWLADKLALRELWAVKEAGGGEKARSTTTASSGAGTTNCLRARLRHDPNPDHGANSDTCDSHDTAAVAQRSTRRRQRNAEDST